MINCKQKFTFSQTESETFNYICCMYARNMWMKHIENKLKADFIIVHPSCWFLLWGFCAHMYTKLCGLLAGAPVPCLHAGSAVPSAALSTFVIPCSSNSTVCWAAAALLLMSDLLLRSFVLQRHSPSPIWFSLKGPTGFSSQKYSECLL